MAKLAKYPRFPAVLLPGSRTHLRKRRICSSPSRFSSPPPPRTHGGRDRHRPKPKRCLRLLSLSRNFGTSFPPVQTWKSPMTSGRCFQPFKISFTLKGQKKSTRASFATFDGFRKPSSLAEISNTANRNSAAIPANISKNCVFIPILPSLYC